MNKLTMSVLLVSMLAACASDKPAEVATAPVAPAAAPAPAPVAEAPKEAAPVSTDALDDANSILAKRSAFFDFDKSVIKAADKPMVQAHGQYLGGRSDRTVVVEGNADERGSSEYNLALGNRRADNTKKVLSVLGVAGKNIDIVSFGKEKPKAECHEESCWTENRRADIVYSPVN